MSGLPDLSPKRHVVFEWTPTQTIRAASMISSNCLDERLPLATAASRNVRFSSAAFWTMAVAWSYPMTGLSAVASISERSTNSPIRSRFSSTPRMQYSRNLSQTRSPFFSVVDMSILLTYLNDRRHAATLVSGFPRFWLAEIIANRARVVPGAHHQGRVSLTWCAVKGRHGLFRLLRRILSSIDRMATSLVDKRPLATEPHCRGDYLRAGTQVLAFRRSYVAISL